MNDLIVSNRALTAREIDEKEYSRKLFKSFRQIFDSDKQPERTVFWIEEKFGRFFIRQVTNLKREKKSEDVLIGKCIKDINAVKIIIGNLAIDCNTTLACWEIYDDFELSSLVEKGRFDHLDLLSGVKDEKQQVELAEQGFMPASNWDFDNIILMHRCPFCGDIYNRNFVLFRDNIRCEGCEELIGINHGQSVIKKLISNVFNGQQRLKKHVQKHSEQKTMVHYYIDPLANSVISWILLNTNLNDPNLLHEFDFAYEEGILHSIFRLSLFNLLRIDIFKKELNECLCRIDPGSTEEDHDFTLTIIKNLGDFVANYGEAKCDYGFYSNLKDGYIRQVIPVLINDIIIKHQKLFHEATK